MSNRNIRVIMNELAEAIEFVQKETKLAKSRRINQQIGEQSINKPNKVRSTRKRIDMLYDEFDQVSYNITLN